jgi:hypothetical protein
MHGSRIKARLTLKTQPARNFPAHAQPTRLLRLTVGWQPLSRRSRPSLTLACWISGEISEPSSADAGAASFSLVPLSDAGSTPAPQAETSARVSGIAEAQWLCELVGVCAPAPASSDTLATCETQSAVSSKEGRRGGAFISLSGILDLQGFPALKTKENEGGRFVTSLTESASQPSARQSAETQQPKHRRTDP